MRVSPRILRLSATWSLSLWWGGFSFYAGRVVFIGHEVLGSKIRQGFITERVTTELNWLALVALAFVGWEFFSRRSTIRRTAWVIWSAALLATLVLFPLHAKLAGMLDFAARQVTDDAHFYGWHRVYLLVATVQWLFGAALIVLQSGDGATIKKGSPISVRGQVRKKVLASGEVAPPQLDLPLAGSD